MLHMFKGLFIDEHGLTLFGRNEQNVRAVRGVDSRAHWKEIKELAQDMSTRWSRETKLGVDDHRKGRRSDRRAHDRLMGWTHDDPAPTGVAGSQ
jgi:hypothetical protein